MDDGTGQGKDAVDRRNESFIEQRIRADREGIELDSRDMVEGISDTSMDAFLRGAIGGENG
jgi:hypothetical protein